MTVNEMCNLPSKPTYRTRPPIWNDAAIRSLALSGAGRLLACGDAAGRAWIFDWVQ